MSVAYKKNGTEIPITSSIMGSVNNNYSTEERKIGTWIDGKPLYQRTFDFGTLPNNGQKKLQTDLLKSNISKAWIYDGFCYSDLYFATLSNANPTVQESNWYFNIYKEDVNNYLQITCVTGNDRSNYSAYVTIRYTKTTD